MCNLHTRLPMGIIITRSIAYIRLTHPKQPAGFHRINHFFHSKWHFVCPVHNLLIQKMKLFLSWVSPSHTEFGKLNEPEF